MFYEKFLNLCEKNGVSPSRALTEMGISKGSLSRWKDGGKPLNENKKLIADYFGIPVTELMEAPIKRPAAGYGDGLSDKETEWLKLYRLIPENRRAEYLAMLEAAQQFANRYHDHIGARVQEIIDYAEDSQDFETFRARLRDMAAEGAPQDLAQGIMRGGVVARLMGRLRAQR